MLYHCPLQLPLRTNIIIWVVGKMRSFTSAPVILLPVSLFWCFQSICVRIVPWILNVIDPAFLFWIILFSLRRQGGCGCEKNNLILCKRIDYILGVYAAVSSWGHLESLPFLLFGCVRLRPDSRTQCWKKACTPRFLGTGFLKSIIAC